MSRFAKQNKYHFNYWLVVVSILALALLLRMGAHLIVEQGKHFINIGTAGITGVYYPTGTAICRLLDREAAYADVVLKCSPEATGGSIFNLNTMAHGDMAVGITQSDWQYHAWNGSSAFASRGADKSLRALFSLQVEPFTIVARRDANINTFEDLKGKRVNIGDPGSGQYANMKVLMKHLDWTDNDFTLVSQLKASEHAEALCDNRIDAFIYVIGHPNASIQEAATTCQVTIMPVEGPAIDSLLAENPYYVMAEIPGGLYRNNPDPVSTFGLKATLVAREDVSDEVAYLLVKSVFENLSQLQRVHPALMMLTPETMLEANSAPFHPGALQYYQEQGWLSDDEEK